MVYWNLNRRCWSVKDTATGRVVAHAARVVLSDAVFKVSEAGRQRVLLTRQKNVHAGAVGVLEPGSHTGRPRCRIRYNPYLHSTFVDLAGRPVSSAGLVVMEPDGKVYVRKTRRKPL
jgi:hypothetical protein